VSPHPRRPADPSQVSKSVLQYLAPTTDTSTKPIASDRLDPRLTWLIASGTAGEPLMYCSLHMEMNNRFSYAKSSMPQDPTTHLQVLCYSFARPDFRRQYYGHGPQLYYLPAPHLTYPGGPGASLGQVTTVLLSPVAGFVSHLKNFFRYPEARRTHCQNRSAGSSGSSHSRG